MPGRAHRGGLAAKPAAVSEAQLRRMVRATPGLTVLTGGQTGVDTYAAIAAQRAGLAVHLVFPRGLRQEDGRLSKARQQQFATATVHELGSASFRYRTWTCAYLADMVVLLDPAGGAGCRETARAARKLGRPLLKVAELDRPMAAATEACLDRADARVFMVAGCRGSLLGKQPGASEEVQAILAEIMAGARAWHDRLVGSPA